MNEIVLKTDEVIEPSRAEQLKAVFVPFVEKLAEFEVQYNEITAAEISKETCARAKRLRLDIAKVRTGTENARKLQKDECIRVGRAIDGFANIVKFATVEKEEKLEAIEKHFERIEAERIQRVADERAAQLSAFECYNVSGLGIMDDLVYNNFITGAKANFEARKEAERKAEEERIAAAKAESEERERIRLENERLRQEAVERERKAVEERKQQEAILAAERSKAESERREIEEKARIEREKAAEEARKIQQEQEAKLAKERAERAKIEAELKAKAEAEQKERERVETIERERIAAEKKAKSAPDKQKIIAYVNSIFAVELPNVTGDEASEMLQNAHSQITLIAQRLLQSSSKL